MPKKPNIEMKAFVRPHSRLTWVLSPANRNLLTLAAQSRPNDTVIAVQFGGLRREADRESAYSQLLDSLSGNGLSGYTILVGLQGGLELSNFFRWYQHIPVPKRPLRGLGLVLVGTPQNFTALPYGVRINTGKRVLALVQSGQKISPQAAADVVAHSYHNAHVELLGDVPLSSIVSPRVLSLIHQHFAKVLSMPR